MKEIRSEYNEDFSGTEQDLKRENELAKNKSDIDIKLRELDLAERQMAIEEKSLTRKGLSEFKAGIISILAAIVAAFGTFIAAYYSGMFDVKKTSVSSQGTIALEKLKFSNDLVKNALISNNPANSLLFYADIGLLEGLKAESVKVYAQKENERINKGDKGPSLLPSFAAAATENASTWLNADTINEIAPNADPKIVNALTTIGNYLLTGFEINKNIKRLSMFLGQIAHETNGFKVISEKGNYPQNTLIKTFGIKEDNVSKYINNPEKILNRIYANRLGNGDESSGDGWRYRGRGFLLVTGRGNYKRYTKQTGIDLLANPNLAEDPYIGLLVAASYWHNFDLNTFADEGSIEQITRRINGGLNGLMSRKRYTELSLKALRK